METPSAGGLYLHPSRAGSRTKTQDLLHSQWGVPCHFLNSHASQTSEDQA